MRLILEYFSWIIFSMNVHSSLARPSFDLWRNPLFKESPWFGNTKGYLTRLNDLGKFFSDFKMIN